MKTIFDLLNENKIRDAGVAEMRQIMGAKRTPAPPAIQAIKGHLENQSEYELYEFLDNCEFWIVTNKDSPGWYQTAGVRVGSGKIEFYYDKEFIERIAGKPGELMFLIAHEASHIFRLHQDRTQVAGKDHTKSNIAQDMVINNDIMQTSDIAGFKPEFIEGGMEMPEEFKKEFNNDRKAYYYENMYDWLEKNQPDEEGEGEGEGQDDGEPKEQKEKDYWKNGSIVKVKSGEHKDEYRKITKVNQDGTYETELVDIKDEYAKARKGKK